MWVTLTKISPHLKSDHRVVHDVLPNQQSVAGRLHHVTQHLPLLVVHVDGGGDPGPHSQPNLGREEGTVHLQQGARRSPLLCLGHSRSTVHDGTFLEYTDHLKLICSLCIYLMVDMLYLIGLTSNKKNKCTFLFSTLKVEENKVPLFFGFDVI